MQSSAKMLERLLRAELKRSEGAYHRERQWDRKYRRHGRVLGLRSALVILRRAASTCEVAAEEFTTEDTESTEDTERRNRRV